MQSGIWLTLSPLYLPGSGEVIDFDPSCRESLTAARRLLPYLISIHHSTLAPAGLAWGHVEINAASSTSAATLVALPICRTSAPVTNGVVGGVSFSRRSRLSAPSVMYNHSSPAIITAYLSAYEQALREATYVGLLTTASSARLLSTIFPEYASSDDAGYRQEYLTTMLGQFKRECPLTILALEALLPKHSAQARALAGVLSVHGYHELSITGCYLHYLNAMAVLGLTLPIAGHRDAADGLDLQVDSASLRGMLIEFLGQCLTPTSMQCLGTSEAKLTLPTPPVPLAEWLDTRAPGLLPSWLTSAAGLVPLSSYSTPYSYLPRWPALAFKVAGHTSNPTESLAVAAHTATPNISPFVFLRSARHRRHLKVLNRFFPPTSVTDSRHQTTHLASLIWALVHQPGPTASAVGNTPSARLRCINGVLRHIPVGSNQLLTMGCLLAGLGLSQSASFVDLYLRSGALWRRASEQQPLLKQLGAYVRKTAHDLRGQPLSHDAVAQCSYYDLLFGRSNNISDWAEEINNRCLYTLHIQAPRLDLVLAPDTTSVVPAWRAPADSTSVSRMARDNDFYRALYKELLLICQPLVTRRNCREPLSDFIARRHEWVTSGSSGGFRSNVVVRRGAKGLGSVVQLQAKVSKRAWSETLKLEDVLEALWVSKPAEVATASEKYENGKARAIYGVDPMHYVINTYATKGFEERFHLVPGLEKGASGAEACSLEVKRALLTGDPSLECTMLDYADFNRHHTPEAQAAIFKAFAEIGSRVGAPADWVQANKWVAEAKRNASSFFPGESKPRRVMQGMFSGTRSTDLINTLLNLAYFNVAKRHLTEAYGCSPDRLYHVHQGDDVWVSNANPIWARAMYYCLNNMGFLFQKHKQMFGQCRGEYLRVLYQGGTARGYFGRAVANYLLRPIQNANPMDPTSWARSASDSAALLVRRGLHPSVAYSVHHDCRHFWARARAHANDRAPVSIPDYVCYAPAIQGGIGAPPPSQLVLPSLLSSHLDPLPKLHSSFQASNISAPTRMTDDWISYVSSRYPHMFGSGGPDAHVLHHISQLRDEIISSNYSADLGKVLPERGWSAYKRDWARAKLTSFSQVRPVTDALPSLVPVSSLEDARSAVLAWFQSSGQAISPTSLYPYLTAHVAQLATGDTGINPPSAQLIDKLAAIITRSLFKSESTLARVRSISRLEAMSLILAEADELGHGDSELSALLAPIIRAHNPAALDLLLGGGGDLVPGFRPYVNVSYWQHMMRSWTGVLFNGYASDPYMSTESMLARDVRGTSVWLNTTLSSPMLTTAVMY